ncbi:MAG: glycoside hydrolase family 95 protein [Oscillospiraceae bacterium]
MKKLWYTHEANNFHEALPIGNGRLGGMVYGGCSQDKISLNEDTLWSGYPKDKSLPNAYRGYCEAKALYKSEKLDDAEKILWKNCLSKWTEAYQPAGNLIIQTDTISTPINYHRELDLSNSIAKTSFQSGSFSYEREAFCSYPDNIMALKYKSTNPKNTSEVSFECPHQCRFIQKNDMLLLKAQAPSYSAPTYFECDNPIVYDSFENNRALTYAVAVKPKLFNGNFTVENGKLLIHSSDFVLFVAIFTNFEGYDKQPLTSKKLPINECEACCIAAADKGYDTIKSSHISDYKTLFNATKLQLGGIDRKNLPTNERLLEHKKDGKDNGLIVLMFDYGRYLTIAASRKNTQPTNLQGIWNEELRAPWSSNYTLNINTEMNYWHVEKCGLSECHLPLLQMISELAQKGEATAQNNYHCRGWCAHHNTDLWRQTEAVGGEGADSGAVGFGFWNISGAWLTRHIMEHYEYTKNLDFLRQNENIIKGASLFMLDRLEKDESGILNTPISTSPENRYLHNEKSYAISRNCAMDIAVTIDVFNAYINTAAILNIDNQLVKDLKQALLKLCKYKIGTNGQLCEWDKEIAEKEPLHRHLSLLYGIYPGHSINSSTDELLKAAKTSMRLRGDEATGWGIAWKINVWARLHNGDKAKLCLDKALRPVENFGYEYAFGGGLYPNMLGAHPPFQIDSNFGVTAGIAEMLLQEDENGVHILPAIPPIWSSGSVSGLCLKGNKTVSFKWENSTVISKTIIAT